MSRRDVRIHETTPTETRRRQDKYFHRLRQQVVGVPVKPKHYPKSRVPTFLLRGCELSIIVVEGAVLGKKRSAPEVLHSKMGFAQDIE